MEPASQAPPDVGMAAVAPGRAFAHASEAEMSRILDFYGVEWRYEPTTFPILWNLDGEVVESFSPDFYLPEFDLYLEMTTLKQSLVRKKNRKLRRLRELYPDIRIKLFYARDFRAMLLKYGRLGLLASLTGTSGQLVGGAPATMAPRPAPGEPAVPALLGTGVVLDVTATTLSMAAEVDAVGPVTDVPGIARSVTGRPGRRARRSCVRSSEPSDRSPGARAEGETA